MLQPKKQKFRKQQKGRSKKRMKETRGLLVSFGSMGLQSLGNAWIKANQIEAARKAIAHVLKREGKVWVRIFPDKPISRLPPEVTLGGGKGEPAFFVALVRRGRMLFEVGGVSDEKATQALRMAGHKVPVRTRIVKRAQ